jgi:hypothetical protein
VSELSRLSNYDFELLVGDLLSAELGVRLESFARGRDKGIDLRYLAPPRTTFIRPAPVPIIQPFGAPPLPPVPRPLVPAPPDIVVQCKHYEKTGLAGLVSKLKNKEKPKVDKLAPKRYLLVTSVDLTAANKTELRALLAPWVLSDADIYGASDIASLLRKHPKIEQAHYKLWITSTAVLDKFLHSDIYRHTEHVLKNVEKNAIRYVQNQSYPAARQMLAKTRVCVIAGRAGIGKSTLAEMLLLEYTAAGYQPVVVSHDVAEANKLWNPDPAVPQIFYYDDFLGQAATADKLNKNEDDRLHVLLSRVVETKSKRLILTTREYILEQAKQDYERLQRMGLDAHKHVVKLEDYTRLHKAQILYNHLYFSELDPEVRSSLVAGKAYVSIINHDNYTPRLIDDISRRAGLDVVKPADFPAYFLGILNDPTTLWQHTFDRSLSPEARLVLLSLASLPVSTTVSALRAVYESLQSDANAKPFFYALKEVDGDFLRTLQQGSLAMVSFSNPSVRDFVLKRLLETAVLRERLLPTVPYFEQVLSLHRQSPTLFNGPVLTHALLRTFESGGCVVASHGGAKQIYILSVMTRAARLASILDVGAPLEVTEPWLANAGQALAAEWAAGAFGNHAEVIPLIESIRLRIPTLAVDLIDAVRVGLVGKEIEDWDDAQFAIDVMEQYGDVITDDDRQVLGDYADEFVKAEVDNLMDLRDPAEIKEQAEQLESIADKFGSSLSRADASRIEQHVSALEDEYDQREDWDGDRSGEYSSGSGGDDGQAIDDLFDSMERD